MMSTAANVPVKPRLKSDSKKGEEIEKKKGPFAKGPNLMVHRLERHKSKLNRQKRY